MSDAPRGTSTETQTEAQTESGSGSAVRGAIVTTAGRAVQLVFQLVGLVVLGRFIAPAEFGLVAMANAVIGIAGLLGDFGVSLSALRSAHLTVRERNTLLWLAVAFGAVLAGVFAALAPAVAGFYGQPDVAVITWALVPLFVVAGASGQYRVDATRRRRYRALVVSDVVGSAAGLAVGVAAAVGGLGYWALVAQTWTGSLVGLVCLVVSCRWLPGAPSWREGRVRHHLSFGALASGTQVANYVSTQVDTVALGRFLGPAVVGVYSRAYQLFALPVSQLTAPLTAIVLPLFAKVEPDRLPAALARAQQAMVYAFLGICLVIAAGGEPLVALVLGPAWDGAGLVVQCLMIGAVFQLSGYVYYWAFLVTGRMRLLFWVEIPPRLVMTALIAVGASQGVVAAALAHSAGLFLGWLVPATTGVRRLGWRPWQLIRGCVRPVVLYLAVYAVAVVVREHLVGLGVGDLAVVAVVMGTVVLALAASLALSPVRRDVGELVRLVRQLRR